jgi:hypothetical protein
VPVVYKIFDTISGDPDPAWYAFMNTLHQKNSTIGAPRLGLDTALSEYNATLVRNGIGDYHLKFDTESDLVVWILTWNQNSTEFSN